ncbi:hypothetical protein B0H63DRAFT_198040 [Podospora didyma]|uniref:Rhodopsin domain-containing protein n=1 Tax=Podospora didyma TaxID=330526 RepID=A0AAE0NGS8_9PEZI|nr:hypothetical protein B0H63DRAFT_198040 [Podospora didyma]
MALPPPVSIPWENDGPRILGATIAITSLALITYSARMWVRLVMVRNIGWDDSIMTFAMALVLAGEGVVIASVHYGAGRHLGDIDPPTNIPIAIKINFVSQPIYLIAICVVKLAVGATLLRIASTKFYKTLILSIMGFMTFYTIGCFFTVVLQCTDLRALWDQSVPANCWDQKTLQGLSYTNVALNILTDLLFAVFIPIPMLWNLNVNRRTRISLLGALSLGCFACAAAFIKISSLVNYGKTGDWLWDSRDITIWTVVECNTGIVAGSLPALRPLFKRILGTTLGYGPRSTGKNSGMGYLRQQDTIQSAHRRGTKPSTMSDETSSERAFNAGHAYEMDNKAGKGNPPNKSTTTSTVFAEIDALSSDESVNRTGLADGGLPRQGIKKTTTTTVNYDANTKY